MGKIGILPMAILSVTLTGCGLNPLASDMNDPCTEECSNKPVDETGCDKGEPMEAHQFSIPRDLNGQEVAVPPGKLKLWVADPAHCLNILWAEFTPRSGTSESWGVRIEADGMPAEQLRIDGNEASSIHRTYGVYAESADTSVTWCITTDETELCLDQDSEQRPV